MKSKKNWEKHTIATGALQKKIKIKYKGRLSIKNEKNKYKPNNQRNMENYIEEKIQKCTRICEQEQGDQRKRDGLTKSANRY